jgi:5-formyltetrahydrofolate cyclo-ligase
MNAGELRKKAGSLRDALSPSERAGKSGLIGQRLAELPEFKGASQALFYVSFKSEVDTAPMREMARSLGKTVAVPRSEAPGRRLIFQTLHSDGELEPGPYGVLQPRHDIEKIADFELPSVVIVPGLAFDPEGNRLGWGAGYYDRFLAGEGAGLPSIGLAFDCQVMEQLPRGPHDVPVNFLITESRIFRNA